ncbi:plexin domain-containing protein 2 [Diachasma alloeum]|uniref:plexin domain-containing protein 2 n=1 Tax=Diachasma alloeum TaxID=454923 RepID=UPI000738106C|nr:plexin domain-containing protein 2 [Diachasma alloeum]
MACEQWCFLARGCIVGFTLCLVVGSSLGDSGDLYKYTTIGENQSIIKHVVLLDDVHHDSRQKRYVEPTPAANSTTTSPVPPGSIHDPPLIKVGTGSTANVTYSTDNASNSTTAPTTTTIAPAVKPEAGKSGQNITATSTPPSATKVPIIWANQTKWANATKDKPLTRDDNKTTKVNLTQSEPSSNSSDIDSIMIDKFNDVTNKTLTQNNITKTEEDNYQYYNSTFYVDESIGRSFWVDLDNHPDKQINSLLSDSHRRAATVKLTFDFPFYGHKVRNITIATGGFLYTGEFVHSWLAATQYIAPLMANFDTRLSDDSHVKYADNGTAFTVEWSKVILQDKQEAGPFTFQVTLHKNGNIVFVYAVMPLLVEEIEDKAHPVKVGLSDAYIMDKTHYYVRRKTIYEYHRVNLSRQDIKNWTVICLKALPTCLEMDNCLDCLTKVPEFACKWCPNLNQCSTGTFRNRQDWVEKDCDKKNIGDAASCPAKKTTDHEPARGSPEGELSASVEPNRLSKDFSALEQTHEHMNMNHMGVSGIIGILLVVSLIAGLAGWAAYAYRNPHSASGQMLIRYRPSQWNWRRGEARYTAATIHM